MRQLWDLFFAFLRIGGFTFGGGYAMLPMLQAEVVEKYRWATEAEVLDYYAISQCAPGITAVNTAAFIGYDRNGFWGAVFAASGVVTPSLVVIMIIAAFLQNFADLAVVQHAFAGVRVAVAVLICNVIIQLWRSGIRDKQGIIIFAVTLGMVLVVSLSPILIVIGALLAGILLLKSGSAHQ